MIERGPAGEIYLRCESGDMVTAFRDSEDRIILHLPPPARGSPRAVLTDAEAAELSQALESLIRKTQ